jgi:VanZ family protein
MPTERFVCLAAGVGLMLALLFVGSHRIPPGWDKAAHVLCFALITALLWRGTAGRAPFVLAACVVAFGALDELHQLFMPGRSAEFLDFVADAAAALTVAGALFIRGKALCAASSQP